MATRLNIVLPKLISPMQTGFMKNRYISDNIVQLHNIIEKCRKTNAEAILISIDFHKAFDTVEWLATYKTLGIFGFGDYFINAIRTLYADPMSSVINNGYWSDWFSLTRSCHQGDPILPLLFN